MKTHSKIFLAVLASACFGFPLEPGRAAPLDYGESTPAAAQPLQPTYAARLKATPRGFIPNVGQLPNDAVKFALRDSGVSAYFTDSGFVLWSGQTESISRDGMEMEVPIAPRWELVGARPVEPVGGDTFDHTLSFFRGNDPSKWHANVPAYRNLRYQEVLSGVEMRVESRARGFEYSFHVQPHAKPDLHFRYDGITALESTFEGDLVVHTAKGHFTESRPIAFQWIDGKKHMVESAFEVVSATEYRIALGSYDEADELVVDPVLDWSTFLGKTYSENLRDIKVDQAGNICVIGDATSTDLPDTAGFSTGPGVNYHNNEWFRDVFVAKFNPSGTELLWLGYLAGAGASKEEVGFGNSLALDSDGNPHLVGFTDSPDFPVTDDSSHAGGWDAFITKIASDGSTILTSSLMGGANDESGWGIALDSQENVLMTGFTLSGDFPATVGTFDTTLGGGQDAFVAKLDSSGALQWSSFLGGANGEERGAAIVADANGDILVTGDTESSDFPVTSGAFDTTLGGANDAFIAKIHSDGSGIQWATFVGGSGLEHDGINQFSPIVLPRGDLALDSAGNILIAGQTLSTDFPGTAGSFQPTLAGDADGYVAKLTADGASLIWASYLGGSGGDQYQEIIWGITLNPWDEVFLIGRTDSPNFPFTPDAVQTSFQGGLQDGFLTTFSADGSQLLYSTYLGGSESRDVLLGLAYDSGNVFVTGWSGSSSYPTTEGAYQTGCFSCDLNGWADGVLLKFLDAFIAHDGFESNDYSGGSGWAGAWTKSGDVSILTSSGPHSGTRHVRMRGTGLLSRTVDVPPGSETITLGFWSKIDSFETQDSAEVRVIRDGNTSMVVATFTSADSDNQYHYTERTLTGFQTANQLEIVFDAKMGDKRDNWYLDDIRVTGTQGSVPPVANAGSDQTVYDTDNNGVESVTLDGSASFDPDGGIVSYEWTENGIFLGDTPTLMVDVSLLGGPWTFALTVTDDEGMTDTDTVVVTVNAPSSGTLHSGDLDGSSAKAGKNWKATVVVTIYDSNESPVPGATVSIQWSDGTSGTYSATTDSSGQCSFTSSPVNNANSVTLSINDVTHATLTYSDGENHDPDGDSNGTSITVTKQ